MAQVKVPTFVARLKAALEQGLKAAEIPARVEYEHLKPTRLYAFHVLSDRFKTVPLLDRHDLVWRIARKALDEKEIFLVSAILTLTPEEIGDRSAKRPAKRKPGSRFKNAAARPNVKKGRKELAAAR